MIKAFLSTLWAETLKARRSRVALMSIVVFSLFPLVAGLLMYILKDPERARAMGLISLKAQLTAGVADWPTFFQVLMLGTAIGGSILFAFITAWVFGREFSDHMAKELLALPTPRGVIVGAKFVLVAIWFTILSLEIFLIGHVVGNVVDIPGWSAGLEWSAFWSVLLVALLTFMLMPFVAFFASVGRGYLPPLLWAFLTLAMAQIATVLGWAEWFPWAVPGLLSSLVGQQVESIELHSYMMVLLVFFVGITATFLWWQRADQAG